MTNATMRAQLQRHLTAPQAPQLMYLAVKLGIPDLLRDGARSAADMAQHTAPTLQASIVSYGEWSSWACLAKSLTRPSLSHR